MTDRARSRRGVRENQKQSKSQFSTPPPGGPAHPPAWITILAALIAGSATVIAAEANQPPSVNLNIQIPMEASQNRSDARDGFRVDEVPEPPRSRLRPSEPSFRLLCGHVLVDVPVDATRTSVRQRASSTTRGQ